MADIGRPVETKNGLTREECRSLRDLKKDYSAWAGGIICTLGVSPPENLTQT